MARAHKPAGTAKAKSPSGEVDAFMVLLDHPLKGDIAAVRKLILAVSPGISEGVKWNAPSFRHTDWFATFHLRSHESVQLVMHTGAKAKDNPALDIPDPNRLLRWLAKDRALATLGAGGVIKDNASAFSALVTAWIRYV